MNPAVILFLIPIAGIALGGFATWLKHKEKLAKISSKGNQENAELFDEVIQQLDHVTQENKSMKRRLEILEAIVTDESFDQTIEKRVESKISLPPTSDSVSRSSSSPRVQRRTRS